jgi:hypothetical protein
MLVYRVETKDGEGPYTGPHNLAFTLLATHQSSDNHPAPRADDIDISYWDRRPMFRFGFKTVEQLHDWFNASERDALRGYGYLMVTYEVCHSRVLVGGRQVAFEYAEAKRLHTTVLS